MTSTLANRLAFSMSPTGPFRDSERAARSCFQVHAFDAVFASKTLPYRTPVGRKYDGTSER
jgi:hypothetical protein